MEKNHHRAIVSELLKRQPTRIGRHRDPGDPVDTLGELTNSDLTTSLGDDMANTNQFLAAPLITAIHGNDDVASAESHAFKIGE